MSSDDFKFPIDLSAVTPMSIDPWTTESLSQEQLDTLAQNVQTCRDAIVFFTACGSASGYGGHTGGAYDTVPEVMLMDAFFRAKPDKFVPVFFDEAGHRVATQYLMSVLRGHMPAEHLVNYRKGGSRMPGHPELGLTPGVQFSSGRLGHMWPYVNGVALANKDKVVFCLGSDGSQQEGNDAEAARLAVAQGLNVKLVIDDNDVTIAGHPSSYMKGYDVGTTLKGHGMNNVADTKGEDLQALYKALRHAVVTPGPAAVIAKRPMIPGVKGVEGTTHGHDAISPKDAIAHLTSRGLHDAASYLKGITKSKDPYGQYLGAGDKGSCRKHWGKVVTDILSQMDEKTRKEKVMAIDCDLEGSTGLNFIHKAHPEIFVPGGIMERGNFSAAAGFGMEKGRQGIFSTFAAFLEMCCSEITMARFNRSNVLAHFSHSGVDDMADNSCHFGINNFFADNGLEEDTSTKLYFPADLNQLEAVTRRIFWDEGMRFIFSNRSSLPAILKEDGTPLYGKGYKYKPGVDEVVREGEHGYIVSFGDALYRCLDAVERLREEGINVGLINKSSLNVIDEDMMAKIGHSRMVLVVESLSRKHGLGVRFGTWLLQRGLAPVYDHIGTHKEGHGGLWEQAYHQGYDSESVQAKVKQMLARPAGYARL